MSRDLNKNILVYVVSVVLVIGIVTTLSGSCIYDTKTNLCEIYGLRCAAGQECAANQAICIINDCGNGVVDSGEVCDDGNVLNDDDCNSHCDGKTLCGNRVLNSEEECDDGLDDSAGCNHIDCKFSRCGDGYPNMAAGEECDDGMMPSPRCNSPVFCKESRCGDNFFNPMDEEQCDTGDNTSACNGHDNINNDMGNCQIPECGDGYTNPAFTPPGVNSMPEACDTNGNTQLCNGHDNMDGLGNCQLARCGDKYWNPMFIPPGGQGAPEMCDTGGNASSCNGNDNVSGLGNCQPARCGDGYTNSAFIPPGGQGAPEMCDTRVNTSSCNGNDNVSGLGNCQPTRCGDGYHNTVTEKCDDGDTANSNETPNACRTDCKTPFCGDGVKDTGEFCDPGGSYENGPVGCQAQAPMCVGCRRCDPVPQP